MSFLGNRPHRPQVTTVTASTICPHCHKDTAKPPSISTKIVDAPDILAMIAEIEAVESKLTPWEREFISSVGDHIGNGRKASEKQLSIIQRIYDEKVV
jgi:hypothetical protein